MISAPQIPEFGHRITRWVEDLRSILNCTHASFFLQNSAAECRISYWVYVSGNANGASLLTKLDHYDQETILDFFPTTVDGEENSDQGWLFTEVVIGRHTGTFSVREVKDT